MKLRACNGIRYFTSKGFSLGGKKALNAFTTRIGGVSSAPFDSLDFSRAAGAEGKRGAKKRGEERGENLRRLGSALGVDSLKCALVSQVHGDRVFKFEPEEGVDERVFDGLPGVEADAIVTASPGATVGVLTADCLPVLLYDPVTGAVGAVHAGWRGTHERIVQKAIEVMVKEYGSRTDDIKAALGPSIGVCCYTVQEEFYDKFCSAFGESAKAFFYFSADEAGTALLEDRRLAFDLKGANRTQLLDSGIATGNIDVSGECTCCNRELFFSYRRDVTICGKSGTGRMLGLVKATGTGRRRL